MSMTVSIPKPSWRLAPEQRQEIARRIRAGNALVDIATDFGISKQAVFDIKRRHVLHVVERRGRLAETKKYDEKAEALNLRMKAALEAAVAEVYGPEAKLSDAVLTFAVSVSTTLSIR